MFLASSYLYNFPPFHYAAFTLQRRKTQQTHTLPPERHRKLTDATTSTSCNHLRLHTHTEHRQAHAWPSVHAKDKGHRYTKSPHSIKPLLPNAPTDFLPPTDIITEHPETHLATRNPTMSIIKIRAQISLLNNAVYMYCITR